MKKLSFIFVTSALLVLFAIHPHAMASSPPCSIVNSPIYRGLYQIEIGGTMLLGGDGIYSTLDAASAAIAKLKDAGACSANSQACTVVDHPIFRDSYAIQTGPTVLNGNLSTYSTLAEASAQVKRMRNNSACSPAGSYCSVVNSKVYFGSYEIQIGDIAIHSTLSQYASIVDAAAAVRTLKDNGVCN